MPQMEQNWSREKRLNEVELRMRSVARRATSSSALVTRMLAAMRRLFSRSTADGAVFTVIGLSGLIVEG